MPTPTYAHGHRAVVFDLDGTLVDTMRSVPQAYTDAIRTLGGGEISPSEVMAVWHMGSTSVVLEHFLGRAVSPDDMECFYRCLAVTTADVEAFPGAVEMLDTLGSQGRALGVFTSATRRAATLMLATAGLEGYFSCVVGGDEVRAPKPAPEGLVRCCLQLGVAAGEAVYVGDAEVDLRCAEAAGALGIHASWGGPADTRQQAALTARNPREVVELLASRAGTAGRVCGGIQVSVARTPWRE
ncbi:HAD family hydrolase [Streptomyces sp. NPDC088400]|uniref:HAD family hydrolase n=1 Tax=Streptomyces sp. NPDC088400 TaxID=3365861 RepID=UPI003825AD30